DVPTIAVEFVSGSRRDRQRDYVEKRQKYIAAGVAEYWIVDRFRRMLTVVRPGPAGPQDQIVAETEKYTRPLLPGFELPVAHRLAQHGHLNESDLPRIAEAHAANPDQPLHELLVEKGFAKEEHVLAALAEEFGLEVVDLSQLHVADETLRAMPLKLVHRRNLMPISRENGTLVVA